MSIRHALSASGLIIASALLLLSCSSSSSPVTPAGVDDLSQPSSRSQSTGNRMIWGMWDVTIDPVSGEMNTIPIRGAGFKANVTMFLQPPAGSITNIRFMNLNLSDFFTQGLVELDVGLTHPFPGLSQYTGFDVIGVFLYNGTCGSLYDNGARYALEGADAVLLNADGYTRWFNPLEFPREGILGYTPGALGTRDFLPAATVNPFKYFADGLAEDQELSDFFSNPAVCDNRGCFTPGSSNMRHYSIRFPMSGGAPDLRFQYGVFASWETPRDGQPPYDIEDFPYSANMAEALVLAGDSSDSDLYYIDETTFGGTLRLELEILDQQGAVRRDGISGEIAGIAVESPDALIPGGCQFFDRRAVGMVAQPGGPASSVYIFEIPNCVPDSQGDKGILVTILSEEPSDYNSGIPGFPYPEGAALAAYWRGSVAVGDELPNLPPVGGDISLYWECPGDPCSGQPFTVEISEAYDPDGNPVNITWDFDGNMDFADDMDGDDTNLAAVYVYGDPGVYECWCRIDDGTQHTDVGPLSITVLDCIPDNPTEVKTVPGESGWISCDVALNAEDGYAYCAINTGSAGTMRVVDVDPIEDAYVRGSVSFGYLQSSIACKGSYVYIGGVYLNGISTIDASDPDNPVEVDNYQQGLSNAMINDLDVVNDYLYAAAQWGGILVFDITDPAHPGFVGQTPGGYGTVINSNCVVVTPDNQWGFYTDGYEVNPDMDDYVKVVDLSDPSNPTVVHTVDLHYHFNTDMDIQGDYLYITESGYFTVLDISDPASAEIVFTSNSGFGGSQYGMDVDGSYAYMVKGIWGSGTLGIIDVSDPENPQPYSTMPISGGGQGVEEWCGLLFIAASYNALDIVQLY